MLHHAVQPGTATPLMRVLYHTCYGSIAIVYERLFGAPLMDETNFDRYTVAVNQMLSCGDALDELLDQFGVLTCGQGVEVGHQQDDYFELFHFDVPKMGLTVEIPRQAPAPRLERRYPQVVEGAHLSIRVV